MIITKANALAMADAIDRHAADPTDESKAAAIRAIEQAIVGIEDWQTVSPKAQLIGLRSGKHDRSALGVWSANWRAYAALDGVT